MSSSRDKMEGGSKPAVVFITCRCSSVAFVYRGTGRIQGELARVTRVTHAPGDEQRMGTPTSYGVVYVFGGRCFDKDRRDLSYTTAAAEGIVAAAGSAGGRGRQRKRSSAADETPRDTARASNGGRQGKKPKTTPESKESHCKVTAAKKTLRSWAAKFGWEKRRRSQAAKLRREKRRTQETAKAQKLATKNSNSVTKIVSKSINTNSDETGGVKRKNKLEEGKEELWDLKMVLGVAQICKAKRQCQTPDCGLVACTVWESRLHPGEPWFTCLDCQDRDFGGWPDRKEELPIDAIGRDLQEAMTEKCTRCLDPRMPDMRSLVAKEGGGKRGDQETTKPQQPAPENANTGAKIMIKNTSDAISTRENESRVTGHSSRGVSTTGSCDRKGVDKSTVVLEKAHRCRFEKNDREEAGDDGSELQDSHCW